MVANIMAITPLIQTTGRADIELDGLEPGVMYLNVL
jgi:hypothetical protein